jgi:hypothetical protein
MCIVILSQNCIAMKIYYILQILLLLLIQQVQAQVYGCTDKLSTNYNPNATVNDGSCVYASASVAVISVNLPAEVRETSGLVFIDGNLYTHNDDSDINIYKLDTIAGTVTERLPITGTANQDWEDIDQDDKYIYIGDFGNNVSGNRSNLRVIRVDKKSLLSGKPVINSINFKYSNQTDFSPKPNNATDFDCEAFIVGKDNIYLFTKQWVSKQTSVYVLPKTPGTHTAQLSGTYNVGGLVTGATYLEDKKLVVLSGYSTLLSPFISLFYDYKGQDFFSGNKRKLNVSLSFNQIEGIATQNGIDYFLSNENFAQAPFINTTQKLHKLTLAPYLSEYLQDIESRSILGTEKTLSGAGISIYPNPAFDIVRIEGKQKMNGRQFTLFDVNGKHVVRGMLNDVSNSVDISALNSGIYFINISGYERDNFKLIKK